MLASVLAATLHGLDGRPVRVEVDVAPGLPGFTIVGLADAALREARERVRGALRNSGFVHPPRRITVNLAPADVPTAGSALDLGIAIAVLVGSEQVRPKGRWALLGELGRGGEVRPVPGRLPTLEDRQAAAWNDDTGVTSRAPLHSPAAEFAILLRSPVGVGCAHKPKLGSGHEHGQR